MFEELKNNWVETENWKADSAIEPSILIFSFYGKDIIRDKDLEIPHKRLHQEGVYIGSDVGIKS